MSLRRSVHTNRELTALGVVGGDTVRFDKFDAGFSGIDGVVGFGAGIFVDSDLRASML